MVEPSFFELEEFELVQAAPDTALLRVTARAPAATRREPTLLIRDGEQIHRVRPLPSPPEPEGWLLAAYSLRIGVLERDPLFSLELSPGVFLELPDPVQRGRIKTWERERSELERSHQATVIELEAAAIEANRTAAALQAEAEDLAAGRRETEAALEATRGRNQQLVAERDELRDEADRLHEALSVANLAAEEAQERAERAAATAREIERIPEAFDPSVPLEEVEHARRALDAALVSLQEQIDTELGRLEEELRSARAQTNAAWEAEGRARADADQLRSARTEQRPEQVMAQIQAAAEDRVRTEVEAEIRAALAAREQRN